MASPGEPLRVVFWGTPDFAVPTLKVLIASEQVVGVVCQPDRPQGRGRRVLPPPVKQLAVRQGVPVHQPQKLKGDLLADELAALKPDLFVVAAYGKILPRAYLEIPAHGCLNVHASLLPRYRGAAPIAWALINAERETGVTIMQMDEGMDTGPMLLAEGLPIGPEETAEELEPRLAALGARLLVEALRRLKAGRLVSQPQAHDQATYAPMLKKEDGWIDWSRPARELHNRVRGLCPWPTAYTTLDGKLLKVLRSRCGEALDQQVPGTVLGAGDEGISVATGQGTLLLTEVQLEGRRRMRAAEFLQGHRIPAGIVLGATPRPGGGT
ncbi:MAG: methionyl-tRNA formyltransferase [Deltaproteobacteria bacterium]|nr:methionyl-tRNA formyltransferase [Deltaproteobacteria bacterium]